VENGQNETIGLILIGGEMGNIFM